MEFPSITDLRTTYERTHDAAFRCIGTLERNTRVCKKDLEAQQRDKVVKVLRKAQPTGNDNRDLIASLLCEECQKTYNQKIKVRKQWERDSPGIDFGKKGSHSPNSLHYRKSTSSRRSSTNLAPASQEARQPARAMARDDIMRSPTPPSPTEGFANNRRRGRSGPDPSINANPVGNDNEATTIQPPRDNSQHDLEDDLMSEASTLPQADREVEGADPEVFERGPLPSDSGPETPPIVPADTRPFYAGEASAWAPGKLRSEVLRILWEDIPGPKSKGSIYAVEVTGTRFVKIGVTTNGNVEQRLKDVQKRHKQKLNLASAVWRSDIPVLELYRLEKLVHADLAFFQYDLRVVRTTPRSTYRQTHREYFEVDLATAELTMKKWWKIMRTIGSRPGKEINPMIKEDVEDCATLKHEIPPHGTDRNDPTWWKQVNSDHQSRVKRWDEAFRLEYGGLKKIRQREIAFWVVGAASLLVVPYLFNFPPSVAYCVTVLTAAACCH